MIIYQQKLNIMILEVNKMKTKNLLAILLTFILSFGVLTVAFAEETAEIPEGYTPIYTAEDLNNIRNDLAGKYILMNDIDLSVYENWEPIGTSETPFTGELDGNGNSILNLTINESCKESGVCNFGLFGYAKNSTIKSIKTTKANINVNFEGTEAAKCRLGTIVGFGYGVSITDCITSGNLTAKGFASTDIGGIIGRSSGVNWLTLCANYSGINAVVDSSATWIYAGGISGASSAVEDKCCNMGNISVNGNGVNSNCQVKIGGIDGKGFECKLKDSYNKGNLSLDFCTEQTYIGGLSGDSYITERSYNSGVITLPESFTGYAGAISGSIGLDGYAFIGDFPYVDNVYFLQTDLPIGYASCVHPDDVAESDYEDTYRSFKELSDSEMENPNSFANFDFDTVWEMEENGYPVLQNQPNFSEKTPEEPTTESTTEPSTEPSTESTTEPSTEPITEPNNSILDYLVGLFAKIAKWIKNAFEFLFNMFV